MDSIVELIMGMSITQWFLLLFFILFCYSNLRRNKVEKEVSDFLNNQVAINKDFQNSFISIGSGRIGYLESISVEPHLPGPNRFEDPYEGLTDIAVRGGEHESRLSDAELRIQYISESLKPITLVPAIRALNSIYGDKEGLIKSIKSEYADFISDLTLAPDMDQNTIKRYKEDATMLMAMFEAPDFSEAMKRVNELDSANHPSPQARPAQTNNLAPEPVEEPLELRQPEIPQPPSPRLFGVTRKDDG